MPSRARQNKPREALGVELTRRWTTGVETRVQQRPDKEGLILMMMTSFRMAQETSRQAMEYQSKEMISSVTMLDLIDYPHYRKVNRNHK